MKAERLRRVLVPLDGSPVAERALPTAWTIASHVGAELATVSWVLHPAIVAARKRYLQEITAAAGPRLESSSEVRLGHSLAAALELAELGSAAGTIVCMASHGHSGPARVLLGSVTEQVVRQARRPVVVVGPHADPAQPLTGRLLVCVDGSPESELVVTPAMEWAGTLGLEPWIVQVAEPDALAVVRMRGLADDVSESAYVSSLSHRAGRTVNWDELHGDRPAEAIVEYAKRCPVGLLALTTHGRTGWQRLRFGSVAAEVVRRSPCPVLLVGPSCGTTLAVERTSTVAVV
jgi:nucleotide-binding universal stress UspA family protein